MLKLLPLGILFNPAKDVVNILIDSPEEKNYALTFYDARGSAVLHTSATSERNKIPISLKSGIYTVVALYGKNRETLKLVVE